MDLGPSSKVGLRPSHQNDFLGSSKQSANDLLHISMQSSFQLGTLGDYNDLPEIL